VRGFPRRTLPLFILLSSAAIPMSAATTECATDDQLYTVTPCSGSPGGVYKIVVKSNASTPANAYSLRCATLDPQGNKVSISSADSSQAAFLTASLDVNPAAPLGDGFLLLKIYPAGITCADPTNPQLPSPLPAPVLEELLPFRLAAVQSPGTLVTNALAITPQVDVAWKVLSKNVVSDNFGARIAKMYYGIVVYLGNNAGYDLQLAGIYFKLPAGAGVMAPLPTDPYRIVRSSLEREELVGLRNTTVNVLRALGPILTGAIPFFRGSTAAAKNHKYTFQIFLDIFSNPFEKMLELVLPDLTVSQLVALDNQALRDGAIVANNTSAPLLVFVDKASLVPPHPVNPGHARIQCATKDWNCDYMQARYDNRKSLRSLLKSDHDPLQVMQALGELTLIGKYVSYGPRVNFSGAPMMTPTSVSK
jgi:hypothetical protein